MRRVVDSEGSGEDETEEINAEMIFDSISDADPVVYQLVRVEGDGRLVPATKDEVIEVDHLLAEDEKVKIPLERCVPIEVLSCKKSVVECSEGLSHSEVTEDDSRKQNARLEYIEGMLQRVKQEERLRLSCASRHLSSKSMDVDAQSSDHLHQLLACNDDLQMGNTSKEIACSTAISENRITNLEPAIDPVISGSSVSEPSASSKPDFLIANGEVCLDHLTVRELQEVFRVSFGRRTNVKDKRWLKRHITMRLTNSLEDKATNASIEEKLSYSIQSNEFKVGSLQANELACQDSANATTKEIEDQQVSCCKRPRKPLLECNANNEDLLMEKCVVKRVRKPNSRYIPDPSEVETEVCTEATMHLTRHDSLGGSGIQIPYAFRVRRGRPRKNFVALVNDHPSGMDAKLVRTLDISVSHQGCDSGSLMLKANAPQLQILRRNTCSGVDHDKRAVELPDLEDEHDNDLVHEKTCPSRDNSDDGAGILSSVRSVTKRNHHRAWTLNEVVKLVNGVARYGLGRWSKIKRLVFASYNYRTSVDLKDKWRNLLKASFAQRLDDKKSTNSRKHASTSIPESILERVKELAEMHTHADYEHGRSKLVGTHPKAVQEKSLGFL